jgi:lupus La protein
MWALYIANPEHWIPIATLASFKRMREFNALGVEWIANALSLSDYLEVDEAKTNVRRLAEVQEPKGQFERSIYAVCFILHIDPRPVNSLGVQKGFGKEEPDTQQKLEDYFNKYGKVNAVRMRRTETKEFKVREAICG